MSAFIKIATSWTKVKKLWVKVAGIWKPAKSAWVKVNGIWKKFYNGNGTGRAIMYSFGFTNDMAVGNLTWKNLDTGQTIFNAGISVEVAVFDLAMVNNIASGSFEFDRGDATSINASRAALWAMINNPAYNNNVIVVSFRNLPVSTQAKYHEIWDDPTVPNGSRSRMIMSTVAIQNLNVPSYIGIFIPSQDLFKEFCVESKASAAIGVELAVTMNGDGTFSQTSTQYGL